MEKKQLTTTLELLAKRIEAEKRAYRAKQAHLEDNHSDFSKKNVAEILFGNITNPLALRKRYRDLVKIFHPDNLYGDEELAQQINKEYLRRRKEE